MVTHCSILARQSPWRRSLACYSPCRCNRVRHSIVTEQQQQRTDFSKNLITSFHHLSLNFNCFSNGWFFMKAEKFFGMVFHLISLSGRIFKDIYLHCLKTYHHFSWKKTLFPSSLISKKIYICIGFIPFPCQMLYRIHWCRLLVLKLLPNVKVTNYDFISQNSYRIFKFPIS